MNLLGAERLAGDRRSVSAIEYAVMAAAIGMVMITIFANFAAKLSVLFARTEPAFRR
jgi:Flp pilus assembly pilin Flp